MHWFDGLRKAWQGLQHCWAAAREFDRRAAECVTTYLNNLASGIELATRPIEELNWLDGGAALQLMLPGSCWWGKARVDPCISEVGGLLGADWEVATYNVVKRERTLSELIREGVGSYVTDLDGRRYPTKKFIRECMRSLRMEEILQLTLPLEEVCPSCGGVGLRLLTSRY